MIAISRDKQLDIAWGVIGGIIALCICALLLNCTPVSSVASDAGNQNDPGLCKLLTGIDSSGTLRTICADAAEVAAIVQFILTLRATTDAGINAQTVDCYPLLNICTSSAERADGILFVAQLRASRLTKDGGH